MKKQTIIPLALCLLILGITESCKSKFDEKKYLTEILNNLEQVKSASYILSSFSSAFDTVPVKTAFPSLFWEFSNATDTIIGASFGSFDIKDTTKMYRAYDGNALISIMHNYEGYGKILIDSVKIDRPIATMCPFFTIAKAVIKYALTTNDSLLTEFHDFGDSLLFRLNIYSVQNVYFEMGKPQYTTKTDGINKNSKYDIWINKSTGLPYKYRRMMEHQTIWLEYSDIKVNQMDIKDFIPSRYFPADYDIEIAGQGKITPPEDNLTGKTAPDWILSDYNNEPFALKDFKSKVLLLNFTGIGCGPCLLSQPFLKQLTTDYEDKSFELISIECWRDDINVVKRHVLNNDITYKYLIANEEVKKIYNPLGIVPTFLILDNNRTIKNVIIGYLAETTAQETINKEIRDAIEKLL